MNAKLWACVMMAVLVAHIALIFIVDHWRKLGAPPPAPPPEPTFATTTYRYVDETGREVKVERQFKVSTKLAGEEALARPAPRTEADPARDESIPR